jgi:hypothetical protein
MSAFRLAEVRGVLVIARRGTTRRLVRLERLSQPATTVASTGSIEL